MEDPCGPGSTGVPSELPTAAEVPGEGACAAVPAEVVVQSWGALPPLEEGDLAYWAMVVELRVDRPAEVGLSAVAADLEDAPEGGHPSALGEVGNQECTVGAEVPGQ